MGAIARTTKVERAQVDVPTGMRTPTHMEVDGVRISFYHGDVAHVESLTIWQAQELVRQLESLKEVRP